ncbi:MAG: YihY/virulence factor BrkB family protein [Casimicrobiaceae bacterium]
MTEASYLSRFSLLVTLRQAFADWRADFATSMGAALAFYALFSIAPVIIIAVAAAGLVFNEQAIRGEVFMQLRNVIGDAGAATVQQLVVNASSPRASWIATLVSIGMLLVGATTVFAELQSDLDRIWKTPSNARYGFMDLVRARLMTFALVMGIGALMLASLVLTTTVSLVGQWWGGWLGGWSTVVQVVDLVVSFGLAWGLFAMIYKILPSCNVMWRDVWIGALVTSILFSVGRVAIGIYLAHSDVSKVYGAAGSIALVMLWVYYAAQVFLFGAEFTHVYATSHGSLASDAVPPRTTPATTAPPPALVRSVIE